MRMGFCALAKDEIPSTSIYEAKNAMKAVQKKKENSLGLRQKTLNIQNVIELSKPEEMFEEV